MSPTALIARPEIKTVAESKNKTIGINAYGGALEAMGRLIVKHFGTDPDRELSILPPALSIRASVQRSETRETRSELKLNKLKWQKKFALAEFAVRGAQESQT